MFNDADQKPSIPCWFRFAERPLQPNPPVADLPPMVTSSLHQMSVSNSGRVSPFGGSTLRTTTSVTKAAVQRTVTSASSSGSGFQSGSGSGSGSGSQSGSRSGSGSGSGSRSSYTGSSYTAIGGGSRSSYTGSSSSGSYTTASGSGKAFVCGDSYLLCAMHTCCNKLCTTRHLMQYLKIVS